MSKTNYSNLNINLIAKSDSDFLHIANSELANSNIFGLGTIYISNYIAVDYYTNNNNNNNSAVDNT
jgi:hypothetical protein